MTSLKLEQSVFDSRETGILSTAFEKAWAFVEFDPKLGGFDASTRQSQLARCLMMLLKLGDTNPTSLANSAIMTLRKNNQSAALIFDPRRDRERNHSGRPAYRLDSVSNPTSGRNAPQTISSIGD